MTRPDRIYAVLAEFDDSERLLGAVRSIRRQGFDSVEAFTPFPVEGLAEELGFADRNVPAAMLTGGIVGALTGFLLQVGATLDYPLWIGGRPLIAVPAFMLITFELAMLGAVLAGIGTMLIANRLPRLNHPLFDSDEFAFESDDRFFLGIIAGENFDRDAAGRALAALHPRAIIDVPARPRT